MLVCVVKVVPYGGRKSCAILIALVSMYGFCNVELKNSVSVCGIFCANIAVVNVRT